MIKLLNIGHNTAGIEVVFDTEEKLFRVTTDSKGGNNERIVEFNDPEAAAAEVMNMAETYNLCHKLPIAHMAEPEGLALFFEKKTRDAS